MVGSDGKSCCPDPPAVLRLVEHYVHIIISILMQQLPLTNYILVVTLNP